MAGWTPAGMANQGWLLRYLLDQDAGWMFQVHTGPVLVSHYECRWLDWRTWDSKIGSTSAAWRGIVKSCGSPSWHDHAATSPTSSGRSTITPFSNRAPARTSATRCGPLTARQRPWAASSSLNAIANPAALEPGPLVTRVLARTGAKVDSIGLLVFKCTQCSAGKSKKHSSASASSLTLATALGHLT